MLIENTFLECLNLSIYFTFKLFVCQGQEFQQQHEDWHAVVPQHIADPPQPDRLSPPHEGSRPGESIKTGYGFDIWQGDSLL